jgi:hypothetical protein
MLAGRATAFDALMGPSWHGAIETKRCTGEFDGIKAFERNVPPKEDSHLPIRDAKGRFTSSATRNTPTTSIAKRTNKKGEPLGLAF